MGGKKKGCFYCNFDFHRHNRQPGSSVEAAVAAVKKVVIVFGVFGVFTDKSAMGIG